MKNRILSLLILPLMTLPSFAHAKKGGGCGGHGGDAISLSFYRMGKTWSEAFQELTDEELGDLPVSFDAAAFDSVVEETRIVSTDRKLIHHLTPDDPGQEVDAMNFGDRSPPEIEVNRARWTSPALAWSAKFNVVLHEYLGILKARSPLSGEWDRYKLSSALIGLLARKRVHEVEVKRTVLARLSKAYSEARPLGSLPIQEETYSCLEVTTLADDPGLLTHPRALRLSLKNPFYVWAQKEIQDLRKNSEIGVGFADLDPTETFDRKGRSRIQDWIRTTDSGDLVIERSTDYRYENQPASRIDPSRGALSYLFCSKRGSQQIHSLRSYMNLLLAGFPDVQGPEWEAYRQGIRKVIDSREYRQCVERKNDKACLALFRKFDAVRIDPGSRLKNVESSLKELIAAVDKEPVVYDQPFKQPHLALSRRYGEIKEELRNLLSLNWTKPRPQSDLTSDPFGMKAFSDALAGSLTERIPHFIRRFKADEDRIVRAQIREWAQIRWPEMAEAEEPVRLLSVTSPARAR